MDELLRQLIEKLGISRSQFAKDINMDRSQVVKTINGVLPVSRRFYSSVMTADFIDYDFKKRFAEEYEKGILPNNNDDLTRRFISGIKKSPDNAITSGDDDTEYLIYSLVKSKLEQGGTVYAVCPHICAAADNALLRALRETGSQSVKRICFGPLSLNEESVDALFNIADYACFGVQTYISEERAGGLLPFGVFSDDFALAFDKEGCGAVITDKEVCFSLTKKHERLTADLYKAVVFVEDEAQTLLSSTELYFGADNIHVCNHFSPIGLTDYNILKTIANPELNDTVRENLAFTTTKAYDQCAKELRATYYTSCSIENFAHTGRIAVITDRYVRPFPASLRAVMLRKLGDMINADKAFIIETDALRYSGDICISDTGLDLCICGQQSLRHDLYCAHFYLRSDRIPGIEGLSKALKTQLPKMRNIMSKIGAEYYLNSLIASLEEDSDKQSQADRIS